MKKILIVICIVILAVIIFFCFIPIHWNISHTITVQVIEDISEGSSIETEMKIEGEYCFYLFRPDRFNGKIEITAFPETIGKNVDLKIAETSPANLIYRSWVGSKLNSNSFGLIKANFGMKQMIIFKSDEKDVINLDGEQTCVILAGNSTLEEARLLLNELQKAR